MKSCQFALSAAVIAICGCSGDSTNFSLSDGGVQGGSDPEKKLIEDDGQQAQVYTELDISQCHFAGAEVQVQEPFIQSGPLAARTGDTSKGFFLAWSVCNPSNAAASAMSYDLLDSVGGGPPRTLQTFTTAAPPATVLQPCSCDPQIVFIDVPAGDDSAIALVPPTQRITGVGAGLHDFTLSAPFASTIRAELQVQ